jgi:hypothetical protein
VLYKQFREVGIAGKDVNRPGLDFREDPRMEVLEFECQRGMLAYALTPRKRLA